MSSRVWRLGKLWVQWLSVLVQICFQVFALWSAWMTRCSWKKPSAAARIRSELRETQVSAQRLFAGRCAATPVWELEAYWGAQIQRVQSVAPLSVRRKQRFSRVLPRVAQPRADLAAMDAAWVVSARAAVRACCALTGTERAVLYRLPDLTLAFSEAICSGLSERAGRALGC